MKNWMEKLKSFYRKAKSPPGWVVAFAYFATLLSIILIIYAIVKGYGNNPYAYIAYGTFALLFIYTLFFTGELIRKLKKKLKLLAEKFTFLGKLASYQFRTKILSLFMLCGNIGYSVFLCYMALHFDSVWYGALSMFYFLLSVTRGGVLYEVQKNEKRFQDRPLRLYKEKLNSYFYSGVMLIALTLALSVALVQMVESGARFDLSKKAVYAFGIFTGYKLITTIYNFIKSKGYEDLIVRAVGYINVAALLVSMLTFQTALLAVLPLEENTARLNAIVGVIVCVLIISMGSHMIDFSVSARKRLVKQSNYLEEEALYQNMDASDESLLPEEDEGNFE